MAWLRHWIEARAATRRQAIYAALVGEELSALQLARLLGRRPGTLYPDLARLETDGAISSRWAGNPFDGYRRRVYRRRADES